VPTQAWPYAVARGRVSGYQAIAGPRFLTDAGLTYLLEYASTGEAGEPGTATVREVIGTTPQPLSVVYRVAVARASRYGLGDDSPLRDQAGRVIPVFEGLVLRIPAGQVASIGLTVSDLDRVSEVSVHAFRRLWTASEAIEPEPTAAIPAGGADLPRLSLRLADPYVVPGSRRGPADERPPEPGPNRSRLIMATVGLGVLALLAWLLVSVLSPSPSPQATVNALCADLKNGQDGAAYQEFSSRYRHSTNQAAFDHRLLGSGTSATCVPGSLQVSGDEATLSLRRADDKVEIVALDMGSESGKWQVNAMTVKP
jgi:hypothetical protein